MRSGRFNRLPAVENFGSCNFEGCIFYGYGYIFNLVEVRIEILLADFARIVFHGTFGIHGGINLVVVGYGVNGYARACRLAVITYLYFLSFGTHCGIGDFEVCHGLVGLALNLICNGEIRRLHSLTDVENGVGVGQCNGERRRSFAVGPVPLR